jgi:uncharacterized protein YlxW (UPF0749 family)
VEEVGVAEGAPTPGRTWRSLAVAVAALAGLLFATTAKAARGTDLRADRRLRLAELITRQERRLGGVERASARLRARLDAATRDAATRDARVLAARAEADALAKPAGLTALSGPGIEVALDDAPRDHAPAPDAPPPSVDDLVVHEQDVHAVLNALWAGGAEAVTIMGRRVVSTSTLRCVGNTLLFNGQVYSPPFVMTAIGDRARLRRALAAEPGVQLFRSYVAAYGLGYSVHDLSDVHAPAYDGPVDLRSAEVR